MDKEIEQRRKNERDGSKQRIHDRLELKSPVGRKNGNTGVYILFLKVTVTAITWRA